VQEEFLPVSTTAGHVASAAATLVRADTAGLICHQLSERGASVQALLSVLARGSAETPPLLAGPPAPGADSAPSMTGRVCRTETDP
jgi:hypothetical protein